MTSRHEITFLIAWSPLWRFISYPLKRSRPGSIVASRESNVREIPRRLRRSLPGTATVAVLVLLALAAIAGRSSSPNQSSPAFNAPELSLDPTDRILILAPHPNDESLATGGVIQKAVSMGLPLRIVFLTNGDANQWSFVLYRKRPELLPGQVEAMGEVRHDEALAAAAVLGVRPEQLTFLGYPDFGTLTIWVTHWGAEAPLRSIFAHATQVPYANAYRPGAPYKGEEILADLEAIIREFQPTKVFLSHPADHNPDHEALYAFSRVALWDLGLTPQIYPYLVHTPGWPLPRGAAPTRPLTPPADLSDQVSWWILPLSQAEISRTQSALEAHRTQYESNARYLSSFIRANELFGDYPDAVLSAGGAELSLETAAPSSTGSEELTDAEQARFIGAEWRTVERAGNDLVLSVTLSKPLAEGVDLSAYLFGYRSGEPFTAMPKIHVKVGELADKVYDQSRELPDAGVQVTRSARDIVLRVPLTLLGKPDRVLVNARTYLADLPLDSAAWRVLDLGTQ